MTITHQTDTHQDLSYTNSDGISLVLPIFNEENCLITELDRSIESLKKTNKSFEIIMIDDCSTDNSKKIIKDYIFEIKKKNVKLDITLIENKKNKGSGFSRKVGSIKAKYENVIWTDVDMSYPNDKLHELYEFFKKSAVDMTVGKRKTEEGYFKILRHSVKFLIRKFAEYLCDEKIEDLNSGFRIFKKSVAQNYYRFLPRGFSCVTTITFSFLCNDHDINYMDINYFKRVGKSKFNIISDTIRYVRQIVLISLIFNPLKVYFNFFAFFLFISIIIGTFGLIRNSAVPNTAAMFFLLSFVFLMFGAFAEAINKSNK